MVWCGQQWVWIASFKWVRENGDFSILMKDIFQVGSWLGVLVLNVLMCREGPCMRLWPDWWGHHDSMNCMHSQLMYPMEGIRACDCGQSICGWYQPLQLALIPVLVTQTFGVSGDFLMWMQTTMFAPHIHHSWSCRPLSGCPVNLVFGPSLQLWEIAIVISLYIN